METQTSGDEGDIEQRREMTELGVSQVGRTYRFLSYRYDRLEDALAYARVVKARASQHLPEDEAPVTFFADDDQPPAASDGPVMASLNISYSAGRYHFANFTYGSLADAMACARQLRRR